MSVKDLKMDVLNKTPTRRSPMPPNHADISNSTNKRFGTVVAQYMHVHQISSLNPAVVTQAADHTGLGGDSYHQWDQYNPPTPTKYSPRAYYDPRIASEDELMEVETPSLDTYQFSNWSVGDGLPNASITKVVRQRCGESCSSGSSGLNDECGPAVDPLQTAIPLHRVLTTIPVSGLGSGGSQEGSQVGDVPLSNTVREGSFISTREGSLYSGRDLTLVCSREGSHHSVCDSSLHRDMALQNRESEKRLRSSIGSNSRGSISTLVSARDTGGPPRDSFHTTLARDHSESHGWDTSQLRDNPATLHEEEKYTTPPPPDKHLQRVGVLDSLADNLEGKENNRRWTVIGIFLMFIGALIHIIGLAILVYIQNKNFAPYNGIYPNGCKDVILMEGAMTSHGVNCTEYLAQQVLDEETVI